MFHLLCLVFRGYFRRHIDIWAEVCRDFVWGITLVPYKGVIGAGFRAKAKIIAWIVRHLWTEIIVAVIVWKLPRINIVIRTKTLLVSPNSSLVTRFLQPCSASKSPRPFKLVFEIFCQPLLNFRKTVTFRSRRRSVLAVDKLMPASIDFTERNRVSLAELEHIGVEVFRRRGRSQIPHNFRINIHLESNRVVQCPHQVLELRERGKT